MQHSPSYPRAFWMVPLALAAPMAAHAAQERAYQEPFRPQFHYTPARNWMNDPNGLVWHRGEYHMFYQYNPEGDTWGNMSWGHAVSRDLVHWKELPVALPFETETDAEGNERITEMFFSGGAVIDHENTSGFGKPGKPAMVAIYTSAYANDVTLENGTFIPSGTQAQSIAYSLDRGRTFTQYENNPVINPWDDPTLNPREFRDPKVFWHKATGRWIMAVILATDHKVRFYGSPNLKEWTFLSDFGPANATGGVWEVPDLFELPVAGEKGRSKWVLVVNLNPGSVGGGSGAQYFVGHFDGTEFHAENVYDTLPPPGVVLEDFEGDGSYADRGWTPTGDFVGLGPAMGNIPPQGGVIDYVGEQLANTFTDEDRAVGTLTSPTFTINSPYINLMVGGGNHVHDPAAGDGSTPSGDLLFPGADFEGPDGVTYEDLDWLATGAFAGQGPATGGPGDPGYLGQKHLQSFIGSDAAVGTLTSPEFEISSPYINFVIGSGNHPYPDEPTAVILRVNGEVLRTATGKDDPTMDWVAWDVSDLLGQTATIEIVDHATGGWGHITADHFIRSDEPALPRPKETTVNLLVEGERVRSSTGENSEQLHWTSWNVAEFAGKEAQIQIVDQNNGGWGHILVDHIVFSHEPKQRADWIDYGRDFYAVVSYENVPGGKRYWVGWMNNWQYANQIPTAPWRSMQSFPRQVGLRTIDGKVELVQKPVEQLKSLRRGPRFTARNAVIPEGETMLIGRGSSGQTLEILAEFELGDADELGLKVRKGAGEETVIGYNVAAAELFVDRSRSGRADFHPLFTNDTSSFPSRETAPFSVHDGLVRMHIFVDASSVEVFGGRGERVITDQIFPSEGSNGVAVYAKHGTAKLKALRVWQLDSIWRGKKKDPE